MRTETHTEIRTTKDPAAYAAAFEGAQWGFGGVMSARILSIEPGQTKSGRKRFVIEITVTYPA